jgi:hypothetical protein
MASIGSVFLGDVQRVRLKSSGSTPASTPPSSPPPTKSVSGQGPPTQPVSTNLSLATSLDSIPQEHHLAPAQSLELRVRWLEALIYGPKHDASLAGLHERRPELKRGETLLRAAEQAHSRMNDVAGTHDALRKFISQCEPLLHIHRRSTNLRAEQTSSTRSISPPRLPFLALSQPLFLPSTQTCLQQSWPPWQRNLSPIFAPRTTTCVRLRLCKKGASLEPGVYQVPTLPFYSAPRTLTPTNGRQRSVAPTTRDASIATRRGSGACCCPREARRKDRPTVCPAGPFEFAYLLCPPLCTHTISRRSTASQNFL